MTQKIITILLTSLKIESTTFCRSREYPMLGQKWRGRREFPKFLEKDGLPSNWFTWIITRINQNHIDVTNIYRFSLKSVSPESKPVVPYSYQITRGDMRDADRTFISETTFGYASKSTRPTTVRLMDLR